MKKLVVVMIAGLILSGCFCIGRCESIGVSTKNVASPPPPSSAPNLPPSTNMAQRFNQPKAYWCKKHGAIGEDILPLYYGNPPRERFYCGKCFREFLDRNVKRAETSD